MRNRAKCKLCKTIIESAWTLDYVTCACGEIAVSGGDQKYECFANDLSNIIRVDDMGNEIIPQIVDKELSDIYLLMKEKKLPKPTKKDLIHELGLMIKNIENLPDHAKSTSVTHFDLCSALILISLIFEAD